MRPIDDPEIDPAEIEAAADEAPTDLKAPEVDPAPEELTEWDTPPAATGAAAPKVLPEDEVAAAEQLVMEGAEEAGRDQRLAAADPDFEP